MGNVFFKSFPHSLNLPFFFAVRKKKDNVIKIGRFACFNFKGTLKEKRGNMLKPKLIILGVDRDP